MESVLSKGRLNYVKSLDGVRGIAALMVIFFHFWSECNQYPIIKKIGKDSLILMTLKQGDDINKSFSQYQNKLDSLKDSIVAKSLLIDSLNIEFNKLK
jgi:hypothetical protein